jgi:hypothetical protein
MITICDQIATATLTGAGTHDLARLLAQLIGKTVVLLDPDFEVRARAGDSGIAAANRWRPDDPGAAPLLRTLAAERRPLRIPAVPDSVLAHGCLAIPITIETTVLGHLLILDGPYGAAPTDDVDLLIGSYVATLFALTLTNERTNTDLGHRYQGVIIDALVAGQFADADDAKAKLEALGMSVDQPFVVGIVGPLPGALDELAGIADELRMALLRAVPDAVAVVRSEDVVMLIPVPGDSDERIVVRLRDALERAGRRPKVRDLRLRCGISVTAHRADEVQRRHQEAQHTMEAASRIDRFGPVVRYGELGIFRLLLQIGDARQLMRFAEDTLGPLLRYDAAHKLDLVHTLTVFLNQRESLKRAARLLHVHTNTVSYRLHRIEQLTPLDLGDPEDRLIAHVAVKILELQDDGRLPTG